MAGTRPRPEPLRPGRKYHVFISYRSVNRIWAITLYDVLRSCGHEVFLDQSALVSGGSLVGQLQDGLEQSQAGILIWSSATADSKWVQREYSTMEARTDNGDFNFVPVLLDQSKLPAFAQTRVFLDFTSYPDGPNGGDLLRLLHAVVGKPLSSEAVHFAAQQDDVARRLMAQIKARVQAGDHDGLVALFNAGGLAMQTSPAPGCAIAEGLTALRSYSSALDVLSRSRKRFPTPFDRSNCGRWPSPGAAKGVTCRTRSPYLANCAHWDTTIPKHSDLRPHLDGPLRRFR